MINIIFPTLSNRGRAAWIVFVIVLVAAALACMARAQPAMPQPAPLPPQLMDLMRAKNRPPLEAQRAPARRTIIGRADAKGNPEVAAIVETSFKVVAPPPLDGTVVTWSFTNRLEGICAGAGHGSTTNSYPGHHIWSGGTTVNLSNALAIPPGLATFSTNFLSTNKQRFFELRP